MIAVFVLLMLELVSGSIVCPDRKKCGDKETCCETNTGYRCCHYPSAVCCPDKAHCCPQGYQCDLTSGMCEKTELESWNRILRSSQNPAQKEEERVPALLGKSDNPLVSCDNFYTCIKSLTLKKDQCCLSNPQSQPGVIHCSNQFYCPAGNTCCKAPTGQWACCPYILGQCCTDGKHCCEYGYDCNCTFTKCKKKKGYSSIPAGVTKKACLL